MASVSLRRCVNVHVDIDGYKLLLDWWSSQLLCVVLCDNIELGIGVVWRCYTCRRAGSNTFLMSERTFRQGVPMSLLTLIPCCLLLHLLLCKLLLKIDELSNGLVDLGEAS